MFTDDRAFTFKHVVNGEPVRSWDCQSTAIVDFAHGERVDLHFKQVQQSNDIGLRRLPTRLQRKGRFQKCRFP